MTFVKKTNTHKEGSYLSPSWPNMTSRERLSAAIQEMLEAYLSCKESIEPRKGSKNVKSLWNHRCKAEPLNFKSTPFRAQQIVIKVNFFFSSNRLINIWLYYKLRVLPMNILKMLSRLLAFKTLLKIAASEGFGTVQDFVVPLASRHVRTSFLFFNSDQSH